MKILVYILLLSALVLYLIAFPQGGPLSVALLGTLAAALVLHTLNWLLEHYKDLSLAFSAILLRRNDWIRVSISQLIRIRIDDRYLLLRGRRIPNQFQPPGGVIKYFDSARPFLEGIAAREDTLIPRDEHSKQDLRLLIKGRLLPQFLRWLSSEEDREVGLWREFYEELVATKIVSPTNFPFIYYRKLHTYRTDVEFSDYSQSYELLVAHIYELLPTDDQIEELRVLQAKHDRRYIWVDAQLVRQRGVVPGERFEATVSPTAQWLF